ncbi:MAG: hypothetical protein Ct9H300mP4_00330 [Gammaproteobacteria bacterium]|nr:MAG: hypothetical protein Ct9H300mP4_00330 [Gammaproteobacteria bacterium]
MWPSPCASMGLSAVSAIYYARFAKYLENRGLTDKKGGKIGAQFLVMVRWTNRKLWVPSILPQEKDWIISSLLLIATYNVLMAG